MVICASLSLQFGTYTSTDFRVTLKGFQSYETGERSRCKAIFITNGIEMNLVMYIGENWVQYYTVNDYSSQSTSLPPNVNCLNTSEPILSPLNNKQAVVLQCATKGGRIAFVVPIPVKSRVSARSVPAEGVIHSSLDGEYILVVNGPLATIYPSTETGVPGKPARLPSEITSVVNLDSDNVRLLTETGEHVVMNLKNSLSEPRYMPGGPPVLSEWVDSSNHYLYITNSSTLYIVNETFTQPEYEPREIANTPEMMFLVESPQHTPTPSPTQITISTNSTHTNSIVGAIAGSVGSSGIVVLIGLSIAVVVVLVRKRRKKKREAGPIHEESNTCSGRSRLHMELNSTLYKMNTSDSTSDSAIEQTTTLSSEPTLQPDTSISPSATTVHDGSQHNLTETLPPPSTPNNDTSDNENDTTLIHHEPKSCSSSTSSEIHCIFPAPQPATEDGPRTTVQCAVQCHTRPFTANHPSCNAENSTSPTVLPESDQSPPHAPSTLVR